ncbi:hypothetical protein MESS4_50073 [Mesorhizobium sp. STM 4661]|nr:hypothetical protein MESS4_50073 [Mesorhizobium sp. STM 4661]
MADPFLHLPIEDRREALGVAADRSGRPAHLLEKDVWVVWALATFTARRSANIWCSRAARRCPKPIRLSSGFPRTST